jgi:hypothetical protein
VKRRRKQRDPWKLQFLKNFPVGVLIGACISFSIAWLLDEAVREAFVENIVRFTTIFAALLGSGLAVAGVLANIEVQNERHFAERNSRLNASKAMLPSILAELSRRCEHNAMIALLNSKNALLPSEKLPNHLEKYLKAEIAPFISDHEFNTFKECLELADDESSGILRYIVHRYQICYSGCHEYDFPEVERDHLARVTSPKSLYLAYEWNCLNMLLEHCLPYSRSEVPRIPNEFASSRFSNIFSGSTQSNFSTVVRVISDYILEAEASSKRGVSDLSDSKGNIDLRYLISEKLI